MFLELKNSVVNVIQIYGKFLRNFLKNYSILALNSLKFSAKLPEIQILFIVINEIVL